MRAPTICERSYRPIALGCKNYLFIGNVGGGKAAAIAYALIKAAKMNKVDSEVWLTWVLQRLPERKSITLVNLCRYIARLVRLPKTEVTNCASEQHYGV